jgi:hypothetical protein
MNAGKNGLRSSWLALASAAAVGCAGPSVRAQERDASDGCRVRLVVGLERAPDAALIGDFERAVGAKLEVAGSIVPDRLYVLSLSADGPVSSCEMAVERLRREPLVRYVDLDVRRKHQAP